MSFCEPTKHNWYENNDSDQVCSRCGANQRHIFETAKAIYTEEAIAFLNSANKPQMVLDFDGVVNSYKTPWAGDCTDIPDPPTRNAKSAIAALRKKYSVVIYSGRCHGIGGMEAIGAWLEKYEIEVDGVVDHKVMGTLFVDDHGYRFDGSWESLLSFAFDRAAMTPWNREVTL